MKNLCGQIFEYFNKPYIHFQNQSFIWNIIRGSVLRNVRVSKQDRIEINLINKLNFMHLKYLEQYKDNL
jgi:hypothetical protein